MSPLNDSNENDKIHTVNSTYGQTGGHKKDIYDQNSTFFFYDYNTFSIVSYTQLLQYSKVDAIFNYSNKFCQRSKLYDIFQKLAHCRPLSE